MKGFGIIGAGMIGRFHAAAIESIAEGELIGCYDRSPDRAKALADEFNCRVYDDLNEMLAEKAIDIVTICTPSGAHAEPAIAAAQAGKHVIVEKPLEITLEKCDAVIQACSQANVKLATIFQSRFHRPFQLLREAIEQGRFGRLAMGNAYVKWYRSQEYYDSGAWRGTRELDGGGALMNQAIHSVDLLLWLMGPVSQLAAMTDTLTHERIEVEDTAVACLRFTNGALGTIEATTSAYPGALKRIEVAGAHGTVVIEEESIQVWRFAEERPEDEKIRRQFQHSASSGGASDPSAISFEAHARQFEDMIEAIETNRQPAIDGFEARKSVELILAIYESARTARFLELAGKGS